MPLFLNGREVETPPISCLSSSLSSKKNHVIVQIEGACDVLLSQFLKYAYIAFCHM